MKPSVVLLFALLGLATTAPRSNAQSASARWRLSTSTQLTATSTGNVVAMNEIIGPGTPPPQMSVFDYTAQGQRLYNGMSGWVAGPEDPARFIEFNVSAMPGHALTVNAVSFEYGAAGVSGSMGSNVYYSTNGWSTRTQLGSGSLTYLNPSMSIFTASLNVTVPNGGTFSVRIYPFALVTQTSQQFATHNTVDIAGTTTPLGLICGTKYNDLDGNGVRSGSEPGLPGWTINLSHNPGSGVVTVPATTDGTGAYCFTGLQAATYTVAEVNQTGWRQTFPAAPGTHTVVLSAGQNVTGMNFGNKALQCIVPPSGMRAWWSGDGTTTDLTTNANTGTLVGGATYAAGMVGQAFLFGTTSDYVTVPNAPSINFGTGDFSIDAWIRTTTHTTVITTKAGGMATNPIGYVFYQSSGNLLLNISDGSQSLTAGFNGSNVRDGQWHFVAVTVQRGTPSVLRLYVDGQVNTFTTTSVNPTGSITNASPQLIGRHQFSPNQGFLGQIDELELFNRVLTPAEITALYNAGSDGKCKPTTTGAERLPVGAPSGYDLGANHPNPFSPLTQIHYGLPQSGPVRLDVFDLLGRRVATLVDGVQAAGRYEVPFDGSGLSEGVYLYRMTSGTFVETRRMVLAR